MGCNTVERESIKSFFLRQRVKLQHYFPSEHARFWIGIKSCTIGTLSALGQIVMVAMYRLSISWPGAVRLGRLQVMIRTGHIFLTI